MLELFTEALANNPEIKASEERWQMTVNRAAQAGVFDDPMLMIKIQNGLLRDPFNFERDATTAKVIGLSQAVPFFGKRGLQRQGALREAEADRWRIEERRIELRRMVKEAWYRISAVDRFLEILEKNITALDDLLRFPRRCTGWARACSRMSSRPSSSDPRWRRCASVSSRDAAP